jgi:hypothetical protein
VEKKKLFVKIRWDNDRVQTYYFNKASEVEAFLLGCEQASGYEEYAITSASKNMLPCAE